MSINYVWNCFGNGGQVKWVVSPNPQPSKPEFQENDSSDLGYNIKLGDWDLGSL